MSNKLTGKVLTTVFIVALLIYLVINPHIVTSLRHTDWYLLLGVALLHVLVIWLNGLFTREIVKVFGKYISGGESFYLSIISTVGNFLMPFRGGAGIRAVYLKKKHGLDYSYFASTMSGNYLIVFLILSLLGLYALAAVHVIEKVYSVWLYLLFAGVFVSTVLVMSFELRAIDRLAGYRAGRIINSMLEGWHSIRTNRTLLLRLMILTLFTIAASMGVYYIEFAAIGIKLSLLQVMLYSVLSSMTLFISITPGSIGIRESVFLIFSSILMITDEQIIQAAIIDRGTLTVVLLFVYLLDRLWLRKLYTTG
jgi:uncharacterized protein (TIRG00374 family)